jgi:hypothetical protein
VFNSPIMGVRCRFSLIYPTKHLLIQHRILSRHELPATWMHSSTERRRNCQSLDSDALADN